MNIDLVVKRQADAVRVSFQRLRYIVRFSVVSAYIPGTERPARCLRCIERLFQLYLQTLSYDEFEIVLDHVFITRKPPGQCGVRVVDSFDDVDSTRRGSCL